LPGTVGIWKQFPFSHWCGPRFFVGSQVSIGISAIWSVPLMDWADMLNPVVVGQTAGYVAGGVEVLIYRVTCQVDSASARMLCPISASRLATPL